MERLEAALDKARQSRQQVEKARVQRPRTAPQGQPQPIDALWSRLREFKVSTRAARNNRIVTLTENKFSAPYDLLRSRILRQMRENGWSSMAVTSPNSACGKTTVTANLAFSFARQLDMRVLVIDLDLRRPSLGRILGARPTHSFHAYLEGTAAVDDVIQRSGANLAFGLNTKPALSPSELLHAGTTAERLKALKTHFAPDLVIYDLPPMAVGDDNVAFLPKVDCALLIGAADSTSIAQLDSCEKEIADLTKVLGVVLNKCRYPDEDNALEREYY